MNGPSPRDDLPAEAAGRGDNAPLKLEQFLPYRLNVVASLVSQALSRIYADRYGIGVPEWRVLVTLGQFGMMTGKAIGAHSHMHKTKVSRAVALLEKRKLVTRRANRADLREAFLALTPAGRAMYDDLAPIALDFANRLSEVVDTADRAAFERGESEMIQAAAEKNTRSDSIAALDPCAQRIERVAMRWPQRVGVVPTAPDQLAADDPMIARVLRIGAESALRRLGLRSDRFRQPRPPRHRRPEHQPNRWRHGQCRQDDHERDYSRCPQQEIQGVALDREFQQ